MSKIHSNDTETLDEKIKRIRKKNEEIEKRRLEVEADKQTAAKLNALVQLNAPKEDWPLPRSHSPDEERGRKVPGTVLEKHKERSRGNVAFGDTINEANKPPPDPAYRFLADAERDPVPAKNLDRSQRHSRGRGYSANKGRGRDHKGRSDGPPCGRGTPVYEAWRAERNRIDEERIRRQRTAQGQWRREWDSQKSEEDWQATSSERTREQNPGLNKLSRTNVPSEPVLSDGAKNKTVLEERKIETVNSGRNLARPNPPSLHTGQELKNVVPTSENRSVQSSGHVLHVSFANQPSVTKASAPSAGRRPAVGSGRVGLPPPPPRPQQLRHTAPHEAAAAGLPQRRPREGRPRRRAAGSGGASRGRKEAAAAAATRKSGRKSSGDGDESWEDADEHSDGDAGSGEVFGGANDGGVGPVSHQQPTTHEQQDDLPVLTDADDVLLSSADSQRERISSNSPENQNECVEKKGQDAPDAKRDVHSEVNDETREFDNRNEGEEKKDQDVPDAKGDIVHSKINDETKTFDVQTSENTSENVENSLHITSVQSVPSYAEYTVDEHIQQECEFSDLGSEEPLTNNKKTASDSRSTVDELEQLHGDNVEEKNCVVMESKDLPNTSLFHEIIKSDIRITSTQPDKIENISKENLDELLEKALVSGGEVAEILKTNLTPNDRTDAKTVSAVNFSEEIVKETDVLLRDSEDRSHSNVCQQNIATNFSEKMDNESSISKEATSVTDEIAMKTVNENLENPNVKGSMERTEVLIRVDKHTLPVTDNESTVAKPPLQGDMTSNSSETSAKLSVNISKFNCENSSEISNEITD